MRTLGSFRDGRLRRVRSIAIVSVLIVVGLMWIGSAQAVHDTGMFELDGNVVHNNATTPPYDWTSLFGAGGSQLIPPDPSNGPVLADTFVDDTDAVDATYFAGGTKIDDQVHNMACGGPAANDKTSMDYVYVALVQVPAGAPDNAGHQVLYLGIEKQAAGNGGDNAFGFWLYQSNVGCTGSGSFTGAHTDGDLFIDGTFTNGGGTSDVEVFRWNGNDTTGSLSAAPIFTGSVCGGAGNDNVCGIANDATIAAGPWRSSPTMAANTFVEAGIDMTDLLGQNGGCFSTFLADSQSSQSTNSQPKDYAGGQFSTCVPPIIDTTATPGGSTNPIGVANQHDVATVSPVGNRPDPTGTVSFFLCNPSEVTAGGCVSGGTQVGSAATIASGSATSDNASGSLTTTVGKYCWRAEYTPDSAGSKFYVGGSHTNSDTECFTVVKNTTLIGTAASSQTVGSAIHDVATLSGATANAGGTITFQAWGPSDNPDCSGNPLFTDTENVNGNGNYQSADFTPSTAGKYYWIASYSGDANNLPAAGTCGDQGETSTIGKKTTLIVTAASSQTIGSSIHDVATLSGATASAGGTITFNLYGPSANPDCSGDPVFTNTVNVSGNGDYNSGDFTPSTAGKYYWIASYSGDANNLPVAGSCGDQGETSTIDKAPTAIVTNATSATIGAPVHDVATLSGATANAGGTITFNLYGPSANPDCSGDPVFTSTVNVSGNGDYNSGNFTPSAAGKYYWIASYSGDANNQPSSGTCGDQGETSTIDKAPTAIVTAATSGTIGDAVHDIATLSGATANAGGTITFNLYGPSANPDCSGDPVFTNTVNVSGNGDYNSGDFTPSTAGKYYWIASYSGDANNQPSSGTCGDQGETSTIDKTTPTIVTTQDPPSGSVGDTYKDQATLTGTVQQNGSGSITWTLYPNNDCSGTPLGTDSTSVDADGTFETPNGVTVDAAGTYYWVASFSGDSNNNQATSGCADEPVVVKGAAIHILKTADHAQVSAGDQIGFTLTVWNSGDGDAKGVTLDDILPTNSGLDWTIADQGDGWSSTCAISAGELTCGPVTVPAGTTQAASTFTVHIVSGTDKTTAGDCDETGVVNNTGSVATTNDGSDHSSASTCVAAPAIHILKTADHAQVSAGDQIGFTMTVWNDGQGDAKGVTLDDILPTNPGLDWTIESQGAGWAGSCAINAGELTCGPVTVPAGTTSDDPAFAVHITSTTTAATGGDCEETGVVHNTGDVSTSNDGSDQSSASTCVQAPAIHILKTADAASVSVGSPIGFTMTVWNDGIGDAHGVTLNDVLPTTAGLSWSIDKQGAGWAGSCKIAAGVLSCGPVTVPSGTTQAASTFTVHVVSGTTGATGGDCPETGVIHNTGSVTTTNDGSDDSSASTCVQAMVDLSIAKSGSPAVQDLGQGNITWTIVVTNHGPSDDTGVTVTDPMPAGNTFVSATTTKGSCTGGAILTCNIGPMAANEQVTITLVTTPSAQGTQTNTAHVVGNRPETNKANNDATASVQITLQNPPPPVFCVAVSKVTPKQLFVGRKTTLNIHVTKQGNAVKGIHVRIKGPKLNLKTKASNSKGAIKQVVKLKKAGVLIFTPIASKHCNTKRVGVTNVFTPPVTG